MIPPSRTRESAPGRRAPALATRRFPLPALAVLVAALLLAGCGGSGDSAGGKTRVKGQWDLSVGTGMRPGR